MKRFQKLISTKDLDILPVEKAHTIPSRWYHENEVFLFEQEHLFSNQWQYVCHVNQIASPGDFYATEVAGNPIIVFRDALGNIKAFYNVCKHRGGPLAIKKGTKTVLQCQYHGWTYLDDGSLRGVPDWNLVELFDKKDFGLKPFEVSIWEGLIFARVEKSSLTVNGLLDGIKNRISPIHLEKLEFYSEEVYKVECNWKVYVDNYLEGYHIPIVHPGLANLLDYRNYATETNEWYSLQHSPFQDGAQNIYSQNGGEAFYYFVFPNIMLNILPGRLQINLVVPVSSNRCKVIFSYFYSDLEKKEQAGMIRDDVAYSHDIQLEDIEICEAVQRGLQSKAYDKGRFSVKRELGVYHFQSLLKKEYRRILTQI